MRRPSRLRRWPMHRSRWGRGGGRSCLVVFCSWLDWTLRRLWRLQCKLKNSHLLRTQILRLRRRMTTKSNSRSPAGMTTRKATTTAKTNGGFFASHRMTIVRGDPLEVIPFGDPFLSVEEELSVAHDLFFAVGVA